MNEKHENMILDDQLLKCPICFDQFGNVLKPIIIPCGHTICSVCIEKIIKNDSITESSENSEISQSSELLSGGRRRYSFEQESLLFSNEDDGFDMNGEENEEEEDEEQEDEEEEDDYFEEEEGDNMSIFEEDEEHQAGANNQAGNMEERKKNDESNKIVKINCPTCRKKTKTQRSNLIVNRAILDLIKSYIESNAVLEESQNNVFCLECNNIVQSAVHSYEFPQHDNMNFKPKYFFDSVKEFLKFNKKVQTSFRHSSKKLFKRFLELVIKSNPNLDVFMKDFTLSHNIYYVLNYLQFKLMKIYSYYQDAVKENNFEEMENKLNNVEAVLNKFTQKLYIPSIMRENFMKSEEIVEKFMSFVRSTVFYKLRSIQNERIKTDRKFLVSVELQDSKVMIYDMRTKSFFNLKYHNIFESFDSKKKKQQRKNYEIQKNFTEYIEISDDGKFLMMLGKADGDSKKFRVFDIQENKLYKKPNMKNKLSSIDMYYYDKKLFVLGGYSDYHYIKECEYFDFRTDQWVDLPSLKIERELKSIFVINDQLVIYFGNNEDNQVDVNVFESLDLKNIRKGWNTFHISNLPNDFSYNGLNAVLSDNLVFIFGGVIRDFEDPVERGYLVDFGKKEVIRELELKGEYKATSTSSVYMDRVCGLYNDKLEEPVEFDLGILGLW